MGDGGMMWDGGRTLKVVVVTPIRALLWVVNANGEMMWTFLRSMDRFRGLLWFLRRRLYWAPGEDGEEALCGLRWVGLMPACAFWRPDMPVAAYSMGLLRLRMSRRRPGDLGDLLKD